MAIGISRTGSHLAKQTLRQQQLEIPLERSAARFGEALFELGQGQFAAKEQLIQRRSLARVQAVGLREDITSDRDLSPLLYLRELRRQPFDEEIEPDGQIH